MSDDIIYISLLILSIPLGFVFTQNKYFLLPKHKAYVSSLIGLFMALLTCQLDIYHSILMSFMNAFILTVINPKYVPIFSFVWCFGYLLFFRTAHLVGLTKPVPYANAIQLVMTLKLVGLAFEVHDSHKRKLRLNKLLTDANATSNILAAPSSRAEEDNDRDKQLLNEIEKLKLETEFQSVDPKPKFFEMVLYSYCYIGILTGPYFKYRTYKDWLQLSTKETLKVNWKSFLIKRAQYAPLIIIVFFFLSKLVTFKDATMDEFYESSFGYRLVYMILIFTLFRFRFYIAWIFAELSFITAIFGVYPRVSEPKPGAGPTNLVELKKFYAKKPDTYELSFETIHNIDEYNCELSPTVKQVLHHWNMSVQYWMAAYIYKRISFRALRQPITMALSAYWHGLHPGYYLSMLTTSPCILAESLMTSGFKKPFLSERYYKYYDFGTWLFRTRLFDYMSIGFILLSYDLTIKFWSSVYFIGHFVCFFFIIVGYILTKMNRRSRSKKDE